MGFSIDSSQAASTILAELSLAEAQEGENPDIEGLTTPQEQIAPEQLQQGTLRGQTKEFLFIKEQISDIPRKLSDSIHEMNQPRLLKLADPKSGLHHLAFKESLIKEKTFKTLETHSQQPLETAKQQPTQEMAKPTQPLPKPHDKADQAARHSLSRAQVPPSSAQIRQSQARQQQSSAKPLEQRLHREVQRQERVSREKSESRSAERSSLPQEPTKTNKPVEREPQAKEQREEEEGFAGGQQQGQQDSDGDDEASTGKKSVEPITAQEFDSYAAEESILTQIFNMRISQFDVLILFIEILKLDIKSRELHKLARRQEREMQIKHMQEVVENYKKQGKDQLFASIGSGLLGIISGIAPVAGHMKGDWILEKLGGFFTSLRDMKKDQFFKSIQKITHTMSEMQKGYGEIQNRFSESHRTYDQHMSELYRADWEESTRTLDDIKENWKGIENFLYQSLQMYHDAIRSLYN